MTTREDIDRALSRFDELTDQQLIGNYYAVEGPVLVAARRGRLLFPSICQTCGGDGRYAWGESAVPLELGPNECDTCGGSGKEWPEKVVEVAAKAILEETKRVGLEERAFAVAVLNALAALAEEEK